MRSSFTSFLTETASSIPERMKQLKTLKITKEPNYTDFLLPDGTRLMTTHNQTHAMAVASLIGASPDDVNARNTALAEVLATGVVRMSARGGIEVGGPMSETQANIIASDWDRKTVMELNVDIQSRPEQRVIAQKSFDIPVNASQLRAWVNAHVSLNEATATPTLTLSWLKSKLSRSNEREARINKTAHFLLPDGTLWTNSSGDDHAMLVKPFGLYRVLEDLKVVRVAAADGYECATPITEAQADTMCFVYDAYQRHDGADNGMIVDCVDGGESFATTSFQRFTKPSVIRSWVNSRMSSTVEAFQSFGQFLEESRSPAQIQKQMRIHLRVVTPDRTFYMLPDGTRLGGSQNNHQALALWAGTTLEEAISKGVVRVISGYGIHCGSKITDAQARNAIDDFIMLNGDNGKMFTVDVVDPKQEFDLVYTHDFDVTNDEINADTLRSIVNRHF